MSGTRSLLDPALTELLGPADQHSAQAITGICDDALRAVLGTCGCRKPLPAGRMLG
jgi:hypothetical protein